MTEKSIFAGEDGLYFHNPKKQGNVALGQAIFYFASQGYNISIPLVDSAEYDLIVEDNDGKLFRIQVKSTRYSRGGNFEVSLLVSGGNMSGRGTKRLISESKCDLVYVLCEDESAYLLPLKVISGMKNLSLSASYQRFRVDRNAPK